MVPFNNRSLLINLNELLNNSFMSNDFKLLRVNNPRI